MTPADVVISGVGLSRVGRRLHLDPVDLAVSASLRAIDDAGLVPEAIDGVSTYPGTAGGTWGTPQRTAAGCGVYDLVRALGLTPLWHSGGEEAAGQLGAIINAVLAVRAGVADHVLCFHTTWESTMQDLAGSRSALESGVRDGQPANRHAAGELEWLLPYAAMRPCAGGLETQRYFHDSGTGREQLAQVALVARRNAAGNPHAVYREPLSLDDYLQARMISEPLCLLDCDAPVDGSVAFIVSNARAAADGRAAPLRVSSFGSAIGMRAAADMLWSRSELRPSDVGVAALYDGFSICVLQWLEALRFCPVGEAGDFVDGGARIGLAGELPISTGGGQLSAGRLHGFGHLWEACVQLRGHGAARQVQPTPEVAVVTNGAMHSTGCLLLTRG